VDLFYSYSTCNGTADDWLKVEEQQRALGGIDLVVNVPTYLFPMLYKRDNVTDEVLTSTGYEYFNNNIPYEGVYPAYFERIRKMSNGDIKSITFMLSTHVSKAAKLAHPSSSFTAAVSDIQHGLADMSNGVSLSWKPARVALLVLTAGQCNQPFWVTAQRLKMTSFTIPITYDRSVLVIPRPGKSDTLKDQVVKVLEPFSYGLWGLLVTSIFITALLSVWFKDKTIDMTRPRPSSVQNRRVAFRNYSGGAAPGVKRRSNAYLRLLVDEFISKGLFFFGAGVEQDENSRYGISSCRIMSCFAVNMPNLCPYLSLPLKTMLFGFGFLILIAVSAYVANLAAFLTKTSQESVLTMTQAVRTGTRICAHPAIREELELQWTDANFYFHSKGNEFNGVLQDYDDGKCGVLIIGLEDTSMDTTFLNKMCEKDLVFTESLAAETPVAFPIRADLASGFSYWMIQGEREGWSIQSSKDLFPQESTCNAFFDPEDAAEVDDFTRISIKNMFLPLVVFALSILIAIILQVVHIIKTRRGEESNLGRHSTLSLTTETRRPSKFDSVKSKGFTPFSVDNSVLNLRRRGTTNDDDSNEVQHHEQRKPEDVAADVESAEE
ncbi:hypothetical protein THAOC_34592, partial [Thalassiosira oceanica]